VRWVPPDQWHVTLRFLGEADEEAAATAVRAVRSAPATAVAGPRVSRLGRSVVCLPVAGLDELAAAVAEATADVGDPPDRRYSGHLTLARLQRRAACRVTDTPFRATFTIDRIVLVRSTLAPDGARHEPLVEVALGG
jgi:2'-5' RNA ligase